jgi:hypothetical protein
MGFSDAATVSSPSVSFAASGVLGVIFGIVTLVILYWIIRTAVRDGILAAWRIRNRAEKEDAAGWDPQPGLGRNGLR